jgi:hypothetical protein
MSATGVDAGPSAVQIRGEVAPTTQGKDMQVEAVGHQSRRHLGQRGFRPAGRQ